MAQQHVRESYRLAALGDSLQALGELDRALEADAAYWGAYAAGADLLLGRGEAAGAAQAYRAGLIHAPDEPGLHYGLAIALYRQGALEEARAAITRAVRLDPFSSKIVEYQGLIDLAQGRDEVGVSRLRRAIDLDPTRPSPWVNLGSWLGRSGEHERAARLFRSARERDPAYLPAYRNLALSWIALGRPDSARAVVEAGLARAPGDSMLQALAGRLGLP
jgi:Flp pilus assembly protein TadD